MQMGWALRPSHPSRDHCASQLQLYQMQRQRLQKMKMDCLCLCLYLCIPRQWIGRYVVLRQRRWRQRQSCRLVDTEQFSVGGVAFAWGRLNTYEDITYVNYSSDYLCFSRGKAKDFIFEMKSKINAIQHKYIRTIDADRRWPWHLSCAMADGSRNS